MIAMLSDVKPNCRENKVGARSSDSKRENWFDIQWEQICAELYVGDFTMGFHEGSGLLV